MRPSAQMRSFRPRRASVWRGGSARSSRRRWPTPATIAAYFFSGPGTLPRASRSGVWGDPTESTAERGLRYLEQIEEACVRFVGDVEALFAAFPERDA